MRARWGSFLFAVNGCEVTSRTRLVLSDLGQPLRYVVRVALAGWLEADGQAALSRLEAALRAACLVPYQDLLFLSDSGGVTATSLLNAPSLSGTRVVDGPNFTGTSGAEYATLREFNLEAEAEYPCRNTAGAVVSWTETVSVTGDGGPVYRIRVPVNTDVLVRQQVSPASVVRATQSGQAVGHTRRPLPPRPLWPAPVFLGDQSAVVRGSPQALGQGYVNYPVSWTYQFESAGPLAGAPGLPPL